MTHPPRRPLSLTDVGQLLERAPFSWYIAGGWALDIVLGGETRPHSDVDVALFRDEQHLVPDYLEGWVFEVVDMKAGQRESWDGTVRLELPLHEIWGRRRESQAWELEFVLNERRGDEWVFRRDPSITLPFERLAATAVNGFPVLPPEIVLLYKSNRLDRRNESDFAAAAPALDASARAWLADAISRTRPGHPWLSALERAPFGRSES